MQEVSKNEEQPVITLTEALKMIAHEPEMKFLWWGIPFAPSVTLIAAKAKAGKSIFMENMANALVNKDTREFLGMPIQTLNRVAVISFEEPLLMRSRRQLKQFQGMGITNPEEITDKILVFNKDQRQFLADREQQESFLETMKKYKPDVLFIDSLGRLGVGQIEDSRFAQEVMLFLRRLSAELDCPVIVLHHTVKAKKSEEVELASMAGSRVISQESDGVITLYDGQDGDKVLKSLAWRYHGDNETAIHLRINQDCLLEFISIKSGSRMQSIDSNQTNAGRILKYMSQVGTATSQELEEVFVRTRIMSRSTLFDCLNKLDLGRPEKGIYTYPAEKVEVVSSRQYRDEEE